MTQAPPRQPASPPSQLRRSSEGRFLMGVCAGLGRYTRIDPVVFRVAFAVLLLGSGIGLFLYLAAYLLMKEPNGRPGIIEQWTRRDFDAETVMALLTAVLAFGLAINLATVWLDMGSLVVGVFLAVSLLAAHTHGVDLVALVRSMPERLSRRRPAGSAAFDSGHNPAFPVSAPGFGAPAGAAPPTTAVRRPSPVTEPGRDRADSPVGPPPTAGVPETSGTSTPETTAPGAADAPQERAAAMRQEAVPVEEAVSDPPGKTSPATAIEGLRQAAAGVRDAAYRASRHRQGDRDTATPAVNAPDAQTPYAAGQAAQDDAGAQPPHAGAQPPHAGATSEDAAAQASHASAQAQDTDAAHAQDASAHAQDTDAAHAQDASAHAQDTDAAHAPDASAQAQDTGAQTQDASGQAEDTDPAAAPETPRPTSRDWEERQYWREQFEGPASPEAVTAEHPVPPYAQEGSYAQQGYRPDPPTAVDHGQGEPFAPHGPYRPLDPARRAAAYSPYDPALYRRPMPAPGPHPRPPHRPQRAPQPKSYIGAITILLAIIVGGIVVVAQARSAAGVSPTIVGGAMLITIGAGLLVAAWWGRGAGLVAGGTAVALVVGMGFVLGGMPKNIGPAEWVPTSVAEAGRLYDVGVGDGKLDLSELELPPGSKVTFNAAVQAGELEVIVPPTVRVEVHATNKVGDIVIGQSLRGGVDLKVNKVLEPEVDPEGKVSTIVLNLKGGLGDMTVRHAA
ncbi:PspC domain-containing protein [Nonomuraea sp. NPDC052634]|uniref:PspC domain-containing protein n=2 Tax=unclassified Nonomuraea TaxID=2593643 RepID=UPI003437656A